MTWTVKCNYLFILSLSSTSHLSPCKFELEQFTESMQTQLNQSQNAIFFSWEYKERNQTQKREKQEKTETQKKKKHSLQKREKKEKSREIEIYKYCQIHESHAFLSIYKNSIEQSYLKTKN